MSLLGAGAAAVVRHAEQAAASKPEETRPKRSTTFAAEVAVAPRASVKAEAEAVSVVTAASAPAAAPSTEKEAHPVFVEVHVERQRIFSVLDQMVERLELALCLPLLVRHSDNTKRNCFFTPNEAELLCACREYSLQAPPIEKTDESEVVPSMDEVLATSLDKMREDVLASTGRLDSVKQMERMLKKSQEKQKKAVLRDDNRDLLEEEEEEDDENGSTDSDEDESDEEDGSDDESFGSDMSDESNSSSSSERAYSVSGYSSSFFDAGKSSTADKEHATSIINAMLKRRQEKEDAKHRGEQEEEEEQEEEGKKPAIFWDPDSKLERVAAQFAKRPRDQTDAEGRRRAPQAGRQARLDSRVARLIEILYSRPLVRNAVRQFLLPQVSEAAKVFLEYARALRHCAEMRLQRTPREEALREEQLRRVYARNVEATQELMQLEEQLQKMRAAGDEELTQRADDVDTYEKRIEWLISHHKSDITKRENASERSMVMEWKNSQLKQISMEHQLTALQNQLTALRRTSTVTESQMRSRRSRLERQLESTIANYDNDMSERQDELDVLTKQLEKERELLADLQQRLRDQEEDYEQLLEERSEEEEAALQRQLWKFLTNRAARIIQRGWRDHLVRKAARRKAARARAIAKAKKKKK